jgi:type 1 glutamine amidotransferase
MNSSNQTRRDLLKAGAALAAASPFFSQASLSARPATEKRPKILFFTKSSGFEHSVVKREGDSPAYAERILKEFAGEAGFDVESTKDGTVFDGDLDQYAAFFFYTTEDLTQAGSDKSPPMSAKGKQRFLDAVAAGKGMLGSHCASDTFHSPGDRRQSQTTLDPYIAMLGGEFISHGPQQEAKMRVVDAKFPGIGAAAEFKLNEEWYSLKNFSNDLHVLLVQETAGMQGQDYARPPYPATWARRHEKGRVFYTSMGHREDVWSNPLFQAIVIGGMRWATGQVEADVTPNLKAVTPEAVALPKG